MFPDKITFTNGNSTALLERVITHEAGKRLKEDIGIYKYIEMNDGRRYSKAGKELPLTLEQINKLKNNNTI